MHFISEDFPMWYWFRPIDGGIEIVASPDAAAYVYAYLIEYVPTNNEYPVDIPTLGPFITDPTGNWGFDGVVETGVAENGWVAWRCPLPSFVTSFGRTETKEYQRVLAVSATLSVLFNRLLSFVSTDHSGKVLPQLMTITGMTAMLRENLMTGFAVTVDMSPALTQWLKEQGPERYRPIVIEAMYQCAKTMDPSGSYTRHEMSYHAHRETPIVSFGLGAQYGIDPADTIVPSQGRGYTLLSSNLSGVEVQLIPLLGVAAFHDAIRKDMETQRAAG